MTAYSEFAVDAFELNALDYLLKPVSPARLDKTINRLRLELCGKEELATENNMKSQLYVHTFGMFLIRDLGSDSIIKWRTKKVKELFGFLFHHEGQPIHRTLIIEELWPDMFADKGSTLLHTTVYQLRKLLKDIGYENVLEYKNEQYILSIEIDSDIKEFYELMRLPNPTQEEIKKLLSLYEGDYFEQEEYSWVIYNQQRLRNALLQKLEMYINDVRDKVKEGDNYYEECLVKMIQIDPYNDEYAYQLMKLYEDTGNHRKLMEVYKDYEEKIKNDLNLKIPYRILKLYRNIIKYITQ